MKAKYESFVRSVENTLEILKDDVGFYNRMNMKSYADAIQTAVRLLQKDFELLDDRKVETFER